MPGKNFWKAFGIGVAVVLLAVAAVLYMQRGAHIELKGSIFKVRTAAMDEGAAVAVVDFRFVNPADYPFVVRNVEVSMVGPDGQTYDGAVVSEMDARRLFDYIKPLGQKYNDSLLMHDHIKPRSTEDRMIAARFEVPEGILQGRKQLKVRIEDVDGPVSELVEKK
jgi:hypothetical protein